ncbi:MAG: phosphosulfolactate synthase [Chitinophagaceae bacterium]|nr:MAG: phosphosulfolactate synthase [Chitinophagaceae bacterium]
MNFHLSHIPERTKQPRSHGLTVVMDKGLSLAETKNLLSVASPHIDMVKLAFGTPLLTLSLKEKVKLYQDHGVTVFLGGIFFEAFVIRGQFDDYLAFIQDHGITCAEVSDGSITITQAEKCGYIEKLSQYGMVMSEVGSRDKDREQVTPPYRWIEIIKTELEAGASYIVAEGRESGTYGIYRDSGEVREGLIEEILTKVPAEKIIWEAPRKDQQLFFIKTVGANVNLANIEPHEVIPLETMRIGLRGDTFHQYLEQADTKQ